MSNLPIACTLTPGDLRARREELLPGLMAQALERVDRPDGVAWRFEARPDLLQSIAAVIDAERQCCAFLRFELTVEPGNGPVWLAVTGPEGTREFLDELQQALGLRPQGSGLS